MSEVLENQERMKTRGIKDVRLIEGHIVGLNAYTETCPSAEALDSVMNGIKELRKARLKLIERYELDIEDVVKGTI